MPLFNRSDLGRLYLSTRHGRPDFRLISDGSVDSLISATTVSFAGRAGTIGNKTWNGTLTARPGHALLGASALGHPMDLLVLYGRQCDAITQTGWNEMVLVEGAVMTADQYGALTALTSVARNIVSSTHTFNADRVLRMSPERLYRLAGFDGKVVAIHVEGARVYVLIAKTVSGSTVALSLGWSDALGRGDWYVAAISGNVTDPASLSPAGSWAQAGLAVLGDHVFIATASDILRVTLPVPGVTTLYPHTVRTEPYTASGSPDQACRTVGMQRVGDLLYVGTLQGKIWCISAPGTVLARSVGGTLNRAFGALEDELFALVDDTTIRVTGAGGYRGSYGGWTGSARAALGAPERFVVLTAEGKVWVQTAATWTESWNFGGALVAAARVSRNLLYAITVAGANRKVWVSVSGGAGWVQVGDPQVAISLCPLPDGNCLVGCDGYLAATALSEQLIVS